MKKGLILKSTGSWYSIKTSDGKIIQCKIKGKLRTLDLKSTNPVSVGDWVDIELIEDSNDVGVIVNIHERKNYIIRKSSNLSKQTQIIAANVDQALLIITLINPITSREFIDRFMAAAEAYRIPVILVINKTDLYDESLILTLQDINETYAKIGYKVIETSVIENKNLDIFRSLLDNKISVLSGNSGVGKSSLINTIFPNINLKVGKISDYHLKGKHTTTFAEMVELPFGGYIIDTPGLKGFGLANIQKEEVYHFFPEIFRKAQTCQYNNCLHLDEPKCSVKDAVLTGEISESRYLSYLSIVDDVNTKYR